MNIPSHATLKAAFPDADTKVVKRAMRNHNHRLEWPEMRELVKALNGHGGRAEYIQDHKGRVV